jgi:hypothetical protein
VEVAHAVTLDVVDEHPLALHEAVVLLARDALPHRGALLQRPGLGLDGGHDAPPFPAATTDSTMFQ